MGHVTNGLYRIDPDIEGCQPPFTVYCNMEESPPSTVVHHNFESKLTIKGPEEVGSFSIDLIYNNATIEQVRALTKTSAKCHYTYKEECLGSMMSGFTFWESFQNVLIHDLTNSSEGLCRGKG